MKTFVLALFVSLGAVYSASGQQGPLEGPIRFAVGEMAFEGGRPQIGLNLVTIGVYPCYNYKIATRTQRKADTIVVTLGGFAPEELCSYAEGPARAQVPMPLSSGTYVVAIARGGATDWLDLIVTDTRLVVRPRGKLAFIQTDTLAFFRPSPRSFLVSCGTPNEPVLCDDLAAWIAVQPGIVRRPLSTGDRIGFPRQNGGSTMDYQLYEYASDVALDRIRRCMRHVADTLTNVVGASVTLQTAAGEVIRAWSSGVYHSPHIAVPREVTSSPLCRAPS